jgi:hypothetical protein
MNANEKLNQISIVLESIARAQAAIIETHENILAIQELIHLALLVESKKEKGEKHEYMV